MLYGFKRKQDSWISALVQESMRNQMPYGRVLDLDTSDNLRH
jgi:hypothetical protein